MLKIKIHMITCLLASGIAGISLHAADTNTGICNEGICTQSISVPEVRAFWQEIASRSIDKSPAGFMHRLRQMEVGRPDLPVSKYKKWWRSDDPLPMQERALERVLNYMKARSFDDYYEYFYALTTSNKLTEQERLCKKRIVVPYVERLQRENQEKKDAECVELACITDDLDDSYPMTRLFIAALCIVGADLNNIPGDLWSQKSRRHPLEMSLYQDDSVLTEHYLKHGANPNMNLGYYPLNLCESVDVAQVLLKYGANIDAQHAKSDLIAGLCCLQAWSHDRDTPSLLREYLKYIHPDETNEYGKKWFNCLARSIKYFSFDRTAQRFAILAEHGCVYDEQEILQIIGTSPGMKKTRKFFIELFAQHKEKHNSLNNNKEKETDAKD